MIDGAWTNHGLKELSGHFRGKVIIYVHMYQRTGRVVVIKQDVLERIGPEYDINGIEL